MDLRKMYQPGIRRNSFYEPDYTPEPPERAMTPEEQRILFGTGTIVIATQKRDPYDGKWIGIGDIVIDTKSKNNTTKETPKCRKR